MVGEQKVTAQTEIESQDTGRGQQLRDEIVYAGQIGGDIHQPVIERQTHNADQGKGSELCRLVVHGPLIEHPCNAEQVIGGKPEGKTNSCRQQIVHSPEVGEQEQGGVVHQECQATNQHILDELADQDR